ncbi:mismatch repair protein MLH3 [Kluyveromyces lactis]|uniref:KLLA0C10032p n=1 Tax=Kluyveromyces lactis (strain ATCC 8585 / CBS 2359 / DSM 70799 / NBRC 1267 / NRRL Y-1140 / WM37) TaxID=284590 RepID=Q6CTU3_KLULA|nr:uncharacterized protein KLLA0_C10032g [Kluyveromyces lactis]CAH01497.1 KLLA0C10032p [Kluyveromyces lactis]|eukprot:XP_452646.1 uncharacterized protein KLLA0_C10032g [Kluyveromyces lactis]
MSIKRLDDTVSSRLKSHESVVSTTAVVRELVQNSVDADATKIKVDINTERFIIEVQDNGFGITPSDLNLLGGHNITSKLESLQQLPAISSYGFRGEALHLMLQCSKVLIISKSKDYSGIWARELPAPAFISDEGKFPLMKGALSGTVIKISDVFYNYPVRRKMMEKQSISDLVSAIRTEILTVLIKFPTLDVSVFINQQLRISSIAVSTLEPYPKQLDTCFHNIFGEILPRKQLKFVSASFKSHTVKGIVSINPIQSKDYQYIFINGRKYSDSRFFSAVNKLFQSTKYVEKNWDSYSVKSVGSPYSAYPLFIIGCEVPLEISDLIQDPGKTIFQSGTLKTLCPLILNVMSSFLKHLGYEPGVDVSTFDNSSYFETAHYFTNTKRVELAVKPTNKHANGNRVHKPQNNKVLEILKSPPRTRGIFSRLLENTTGGRQCRDHHYDSEFDIQKLNLAGTESSYLKNHAVSDFKLSKSQIRNFEVIQQVDLKFILVKSGGTLLMLDQHACHERILVENMLKETIIKCMNKCFNYVKLNMKMNISAEEAGWFRESIPEFDTWGIVLEIKDIDTRSSVIELIKAPEFFHEKIKHDSAFLKHVLLQHIYDLRSSKRRRITQLMKEQHSSNKWWIMVPHMPRVYTEIINSKSCRSAIMFGTSLSRTECDVMISDLSKCQQPFHCAHGRPSVVPIVEINDSIFGFSDKDYEILL